MKKQSDSGGVNNLGVIVEAKHEYTQQLCNVLRPAVYDGLLTMYNNAVNVSETTNDILYHFQTELTTVPKWNNLMIKRETDHIIESCSYFNELITAVFLSNVKILSSVKLGSTNKKFQLVIPTNDNFVHQVYIKVCKKIFDNPYLFSLKKYNNNITNNMADTFEVIDDCVAQSVRDMLPIKHILESYICKDPSEEEDDVDSEGTYEDIEYPDRTSFESEAHVEDPVPEEEPVSETKEDNNTIMGNLFEKPPPESGSSTTDDDEQELTKEISFGATAANTPPPPPPVVVGNVDHGPNTFFDDV
jgi:hypothetical protein